MMESYYSIICTIYLQAKVDSESVLLTHTVTSVITDEIVFGQLSGSLFPSESLALFCSTLL